MKEVLREYGGAFLAAACAISVAGVFAVLFLGSSSTFSRALSEVMSQMTG